MGFIKPLKDKGAFFPRSRLAAWPAKEYRLPHARTPLSFPREPGPELMKRALARGPTAGTPYANGQASWGPRATPPPWPRFPLRFFSGTLRDRAPCSPNTARSRVSTSSWGPDWPFRSAETGTPGSANHPPAPHHQVLVVRVSHKYKGALGGGGTPSNLTLGVCIRQDSH